MLPSNRESQTEPLLWSYLVIGQGAHHSFGCAPVVSLQRASVAYPAYSWRHGQIWRLVLVKVLNLSHTALQCVFISGLHEKFSVSVVKHSTIVLPSVPF